MSTSSSRMPVKLSIYYDYDSKPPGEDPVKYDYGIVTSLGYSF